ncbi:MAG: allantoate amidohydrolase [Pantoea sp. Brub]|nr:allantoate amidohydrolase [Pantoea sp. Brub]
MMMNINEARIAAKRVMLRCKELSKISSTKNGLTRTYLSKEHLQANKLVGNWMAEAGMEIWQDAVGNICGRYESIKLGAPALVLGSHLDTVYNAGYYDGVLGVLAAIEIVHWLNKNKIHFIVSIEVIGFGDEEGIRFGIPFLGSKGISGTWHKNWVCKSDINNITIKQAMKEIGLDSNKISYAARNKEDIIAYLELHIEQGPCLENEDLALGVVTNIHAARRFECKFIGESGHAGTVPMSYRKDALVASAKWISFIEEIALINISQVVATVNIINCKPGAVNIIPGKVDLLLDIRASKNYILDYLISIILNKAKYIAKCSGLNFKFNELYRMKSIVFDSDLKKILCDVLIKTQGRCFSLPSGAGHDAVSFAKNWPVAMIFIRNHRGISHHPSESVDLEDVTLALQAYLTSVYKIIEYKSNI